MRSRNIKPGFFINEDLAEYRPLTRLLFIGLWCAADREGRLQDRPKRIKAQVLPFDECNVDQLLEELVGGGFIVRYVVDGAGYIAIPAFLDHQKPHPREAPSAIPRQDLGKTKALPSLEKSKPSPADIRIPDVLIPDTKAVGAPPMAEPPADCGSPTAITVPMTGKRNHAVTDADIARLRELHPAIDPMQSLRRMVAWLEADPSRQSATVKGVRKRIASWLGGDQDKAGAGGARASPGVPRPQIGGSPERPPEDPAIARRKHEEYMRSLMP